MSKVMYEMRLLISPDRVSTILEVLSGSCELVSLVKQNETAEQSVVGASSKKKRRKGVVSNRKPKFGVRRTDMLYEYLNDVGPRSYSDIVKNFPQVPAGSISSALYSLKGERRAKMADGVWQAT